MKSTRRRWRWLDQAAILAVHEEQLAEHGAAAGVRDPNGLALALAKPEQLANHGRPDAADLAASYGFGIARNRPFIDGNKRTALVAVELFLALNDAVLLAPDADCVCTILDLAAGKITEANFGAWIREHARAVAS